MQKKAEGSGSLWNVNSWHWYYCNQDSTLINFELGKIKTIQKSQKI